MLHRRTIGLQPFINSYGDQIYPRRIEAPARIAAIGDQTARFTTCRAMDGVIIIFFQAQGVELIFSSPKPAPDATRNSTGTIETAKSRESNALLDQTNKRPQHVSRGSASKDGRC